MITYAIISFNPCGPFYQYGMTLISAWISNYIHYTLSDEITYPFPFFFKYGELIRIFTPHIVMDTITYPCWN